MGPNGSGKSTLGGRAAGGRLYVTGGEVLTTARTCWSRPGGARARRAVLAFQYPWRFRCEQHLFPQGGAERDSQHKGESELDAMEFLTLVKEKMKLLGV